MYDQKNINQNKLTRNSVKRIEPKIKYIDEKIRGLSEDKLIQPNFREYKKKPFLKTKYAYATLIIIDEDYIAGALVLGYSLRKYSNNYNLICLVQDHPEKVIINGVEKNFTGVSRKMIDDLLEIFDIVYGVSLIQINIPKTGMHYSEIIPHYRNASVYPTKSQIFGLLNYEKILYFDATIVVYKNINYIFEKYDNAFLYDFMYKKMNMGVQGAMILFKPSKYYYTKALLLSKKYNTIFKDLFFGRGIVEVVIYFTVYPNWSKKLIPLFTKCEEFYEKEFYKKDCPIYHYRIHKPFKMNNSDGYKKKNRQYTFKYWDIMGREFLSKYSNPNFKKYFSYFLSRQIPESH